MTSSPTVLLDRTRINDAKAAYATRRIPREHMLTLITGDVVPKEGDLALARVEKIGQHQRIELENGRRSRLFAGDEVLLVIGNRYAPDQFEAIVPSGLGICAMAAAGGIAAEVVCKSDKVSTATVIHILGLVGNGAGHVLNLTDYALPEVPLLPCKMVLAVAGTAMNAGKTETVINLIRGLVDSGYRVGAAKITGTGAGGDIWAARDAGANPVLDFTDGGLPSTYHAPAEAVERVALNLIAHLSTAMVDAIVLELGDGLFQAETSQLLQSQRLTSSIDGILFAAGDALGATAGVRWLKERQLPVVAISGVLTQSPLAIREVSYATDMPVFDMPTLRSPQGVQNLLSQLALSPDLVA